MNNLAVFAVTPKGVALARSIACALGGSVFVPMRMVDTNPIVQEVGFESLRECVSEVFNDFSSHVFITAAGIAVRAIAPHLVSKDVDPAVVVMDQNGQHVISLLSGHLGGANELAKVVAQLIGGVAVITTATDSEKLPSLDMVAVEAGCAIYNIDAVKHVNGALLAGEKVVLDDPADVLGLKHGQLAELFTPAELVPFAEEDGPSVVVSWRSAELIEPEEKTLLLHPKVLCVGIGAKRGVAKETVLGVIRTTFEKHDLAIESIAYLASVNAKMEEEGIIEAAEALGVPFVTFAADVLDGVDVPNPSDAPMQAVGTKSVAEAAALHCASLKHEARLVVEKEKGDGVTCAVALEI
ncbi:cobalt-precorrin 5A hydrolase [Halodesulfovibrio marinisediminis]|uniref:Cobalt-precorrin 5A hydrolase n=1 Tax=Halodesulfovibrio marinisediminis DSM 17456 TaxID=1121457 RepID=A0A1N6F3I3_9BACT|nr:cobalamin biosynthesis protein [Halodesulfovibrio marinisediminis]SIN89825.1 cobalt-precorrin 5A hydrolase [Halodesulfovibrio marinisediminis DSM 17456]